MKKKINATLALLLICLISLSIARNAFADISTPTWLNPAWEGVNDPVLGLVSIGYVTGSTWMLKIVASNNVFNGTGQAVDVTVTNIAVWFDWNTNYTTALNVLIPIGTSYFFVINGTTESTSIASNLFTHSYKVYVNYEYTTPSGGAQTTVRGSWVYSNGAGFAVLSQDQFDAAAAESGYTDFKNMVGNLVDNYAESNSLYVQAQIEKQAGDNSYESEDFSGALDHYNTASSLLNQSWISYVSIQTQYDTNTLNNDKADAAITQGEADALEANATATTTAAQGLANSMMINSVAFVFFGIGFICFGLGAIYYARKPKQTT